MKFLIYILLIYSIAFCDFGGGYSGISTRHGSSAREISLANSLVANNNLGFNTFTNPSLISNTKNIEIGSSIFSLTNDRSVQVISICKKLPPSAGAGISFFRSSMNNIVGINSDEFYTGDMKFSDSYLMLSFGVKFHRLLSLGINGKTMFQRYFLSDNEKYISKGIALDIAFSSSLSEQLNIGVQFESVIGEYNWNQSISSNSIPYKEKIPLRFLAGLSYNPFNESLILFQFETISIPEGSLSKRLSLGIELPVNIVEKFNPILFRFGLKQARWLDDKLDLKSNLISPSAGFGIQLKIYKKILLNLDYAIDFNYLGINNLFSFKTEI